MKKVYLCFSSNDVWYGKITQYLTGSRVNHCFFAFQSDDFGEDMMVQVDHRGIVIIGLAGNVGMGKNFYIFESKEKDMWSGILRNNNYIGDKYDWLGVFGFLLKLFVAHIFRIKIKNPIHRKGDFFCSEYVATILRSCGLFDGDPASTSPGDLLLIIEKSIYFSRKLKIERKTG